MASITPVLDSYLQHKQLILCLGHESKKHPINLYLFQLVVMHLIDLIGDDDLLFEIEELFPQLHNKGEIL